MPVVYMLRASEAAVPTRRASRYSKIVRET
jgi:hypothetical protein